MPWLIMLQVYRLETFEANYEGIRCNQALNIVPIRSGKSSFTF
jgi:hypothetical protein